jgi:hypothetical protein
MIRDPACALNPSRLTRIGDVFVMAMYHPPYGPYEIRNEVTVLEPDIAVEWRPFSLGAGHGADFGYKLRAAGPDTEVMSYRDWSALPAPLGRRLSLPFITSAQLAMTSESVETVLRRDNGGRPAPGP